MITPGNALRLAVVADVHHGPAIDAKAGPASAALLRSVLREIESEGHELLIDLGDRINDDGRDADLANMRAVAAVFAEAGKLERHHLPGNHDLYALSVGENEEILGAPLRSRVVRRGGWNLVMWCADPRVHIAGFAAPTDDIEWLAETLEGLRGPTAVFSHVALGGGSMRGNYYFDGTEWPVASYTNLDDVHDVLLANDSVKLVVSGHVHWNSLNTIDGVPFMTVQSLSDTATTHPLPTMAWAALDIDESRARLSVAGRDPLQLSVPLRGSGRHWLVRPQNERSWSKRAKGSTAREVEGVILDLDGVIYAGSSLLPGAGEFLQELRDSGRRLVAVTNHSGRGAAEVVAALSELGLRLELREVITSIDAVVALLLQRHPAASVMVIGSDALRQAVLDAGFTESGEPDAVVVGYLPVLDAEALGAAGEALARGAAFIGTNQDAWLPRPDGSREPETGPVLSYLTGLSGRLPRIVGKPAPTIARLALARLGLEPAKVMWVGDTLATDIAGAAAAGALSALVLTGNTPASRAYRPQPDLVVADLVELRAWLAETP